MALESLTNESILIAMMWQGLQIEFEIPPGQPLFWETAVLHTPIVEVHPGMHVSFF